MATDVQRGGLGFEKFFRRRSSSAERSKDREKSVKVTKDDAETLSKEEKETTRSKFGKFFGKNPEDTNNPPDDTKAAKEDPEDGGERTDSKKFWKKRRPGSPESSSEKTEKGDATETCKELVIKDDVGQVKLTEIINNSIKEAVLNIVKEGVCPLTDPGDQRSKEPAKKSPCSLVQEPQDKENKPGSPEHLSSLISGANKTFDSHLCQSQCQRSSQRSSRGGFKSNDQDDRVKVNRTTGDGSPCVNKIRKASKVTKKDRNSKQGGAKICHQAKGPSSHFRTDNRRMTGNVNIYICSEANETNAKDKKPKSRKDSVDDSESAASSSLSASTSKLVAALRKKRKNLDDQPSSCICDEASGERYQNDGDTGDDLLCLCDEDNADPDCPDTHSGSSRDACVCDDEKISDNDFPSGTGSLERPCTSVASEEFASYDADDLWPCNNYDGSSRARRFDAENQDDDAEEDPEERCSCCNPNRSSKKPIVVPCPNWKNQFEQRRPREKICRAARDTSQFGKCLCVVEEEDEECCNDRKESKEKFTVCGNSSTNEDRDNAEEPKDEPEKSPSTSTSGLLRKKRDKSGSPKAERSKSARTLVFASDSQAMPDKDDKEADVKDAEESKLQSPKLNLLSTLKNFKRSLSRERRDSKVATPEAPKEEDQKNKTEENGENLVASKEADDNKDELAADEKQKGSFFYRSLRKAMDIVKTRKDSDEPAAVVNEETGKTDTNSDETKNGTAGSSEGNDEKKITLNSVKKLNRENRSRSRISAAIASRRSPATSNENSSVSLSGGQANDATKSEAYGRGCQCGKIPDRCECRCNKAQPISDEICKCRTKCRPTKSGNICCQKLASPGRESSCPKCGKCGQSAAKCVCCAARSEPVESDPTNPCKCCPKCSRPIPECSCCSCRKSVPESDPHKCCQKCSRPIPECSCCCSSGKSEIQSDPCKCCPKCSKPLPECRCCCSKPKCRLPDFSENLLNCSACCSPKSDCRCRPLSSWECSKSMICVYCDKPQDSCICKAPVRKCSQCGLPDDVCNCKPVAATGCNCSGRQIVQTRGNDEQTISVTAWKPRRSVRRYFARDEELPEDFEDDCACCEKSKPYGSDRLAYQQSSVFSNVMTELQRKISGSVCCNVCRNVPCDCCRAEYKVQVERRPRRRLNTIVERRSVRPEERSKSPAGSCRCSTPGGKPGRRAQVSKFCDRCRTSPCRCRRSGASSTRKKPQAKCYYCKNSPCNCEPICEPTTIPRPVGKADSSRRREKEFSANADVANEDNGHRGRDHVSPCPSSRRPRKYCCRGNSAGASNHLERAS